MDRRYRVHETGKKLLGLMFRDGETICVSPNQYGWHSIPLNNAMDGRITLVHPNPNKPIQYCDSSELIFVALNPIKGFRTDINSTAFRNFLLEIDVGSIETQIEYIKRIGVPYSAIVFSGSKSAHVLISLDKDLPNEKIWRTFSEWMINIATLLDINCKNPSRSIRLPGSIRPETGKEQKLLEFNGKVKIEDLATWLALHPDAKPIERVRRPPSGTLDIEGLKPWVADRLINGLDPRQGRNIQWFSLAYEFALQSYSEDDTISILSEFFTPDRDFKEKEFLTCIDSAFKKVYGNK